tara:strand:+ start:4503 stop:4850 length:348 start_codon:yes stop_codon:yes gene_type:complete
MKLVNYYNNNKETWISELMALWKDGIWTDVCLDEYCAYKVWVYSQGEEYFEQMKLYMESATNEKYSIEDLKKDSWNLYLSDLGIHVKPFAKRLKDGIDQKGNVIDNIHHNDRGIA